MPYSVVGEDDLVYSQHETKEEAKTSKWCLENETFPGYSFRIINDLPWNAKGLPGTAFSLKMNYPVVCDFCGKKTRVVCCGTDFGTETCQKVFCNKCGIFYEDYGRMICPDCINLIN